MHGYTEAGVRSIKVIPYYIDQSPTSHPHQTSKGTVPLKRYRHPCGSCFGTVILRILNEANWGFVLFLMSFSPQPLSISHLNTFVVKWIKTSSAH